MKHMILNDGTYATGNFVPEGATVIDTPKPNDGYSWNGSEWIFDGFSAEQSMEILRVQRNLKLAETDWMANSDVTMSSEWQTYRQALRDLPANSTPSLDENGQLTGVEWPNKPE